MTTYDLFTYPQAPGFKERTTSKDAAQASASSAAVIREAVWRVIKAAGAAGLTADEAAALVERSILSVRPRVSELRQVNRIIATGARRANESGMKAKVWRAS